MYGTTPWAVRRTTCTGRRRGPIASTPERGGARVVLAMGRSPRLPAMGRSARRSQLRDPSGPAFASDPGARLAGQLPCAAEKSVQRVRPPYVPVQGVLGGEADAAEDLLAVAGGGQGRAARGGLGEQGAQVAVVVVR